MLQKDHPLMGENKYTMQSAVQLITMHTELTDDGKRQSHFCRECTYALIPRYHFEAVAVHLSQSQLKTCNYSCLNNITKSTVLCIKIVLVCSTTCKHVVQLHESSGVLVQKLTQSYSGAKC